MILNSYAVLDAFLSLLRLGLGALVLGLGFYAWRGWRRRAIGEDADRQEARGHLVLLLAIVLLGLNVLSWPVFYLLLQSYVPEWPGVMCIYGVTRIGSGSLGISRFLPSLVTTVQALKPALVFVSGAWFVLHLINRRTRTAPLTGRVLLVLLASGLLAVGDAAAEVAYLAIPKKERFLSAGCCTGIFTEEPAASRFLPAAWIGDRATPWLYGAYYAVNLNLVLALVLCRRRIQRLALGSLTPILLAAVIALAISALFLIEAAAPRLLHLPNHHCVYDLVPRAPESLVAVALFLGASFSLGWAWIAWRLGKGVELGPYLPETIERLLYLGLLGYIGSTVILSVELALA
jgi:hypothetical protein